jgi:hypothetical protein
MWLIHERKVTATMVLLYTTLESILSSATFGNASQLAPRTAFLAGCAELCEMTLASASLLPSMVIGKFLMFVSRLFKIGSKQCAESRSVVEKKVRHRKIPFCRSIVSCL